MAPLASPAGGNRLTLRVRAIELVGGFPELREAAETLIKPLERRQISVEQLFALANALEKLYVERGYALVRIVVPPQQLREGGDARIQVIDGYIESLSLTGVPPRARAVVSERVSPLIGRRRLKYAVLERAALLAGDVAGLRLRTALARGKAQGGVVLALEGEARLITGSLGTDNNLPASLGAKEWTTRLALNNALELGEQIYLSVGSGYALALHGFPNSPLRTLGVGAIAPLGADGLTISPEILQSISRPAPEPGAPASLGVYERFALIGSYPVERTRASNLNATAALEAIDQRLYGPAVGADISHDKYAALRLGANWQGATFWGAPAQAEALLSQGLGGRHADSAAPLTRRGAGPNFTTFSAAIKLSQQLPAEFRLDLTARARWAFQKPQLISEEFALDSADAVSAFTQGTFSVDAGETLRLEAGRAFATPSAYGVASVSPYVFAAQGYGVIHEATAAEQGRFQTYAFGLGARLAFDASDSFTGASLGLELARGFSNAAGERRVNRAEANLSLHF